MILRKVTGEMKKKVVLWGVVIALVLAVAGVVVWIVLPKHLLKDVEASEVSRIEVFDRTAGRTFVIRNPEQIAYIVENLKSVSVKWDGLALGYTGMVYSITLFDAKDVSYSETMTLATDNRVIEGFSFYKADRGLCLDYIRDIADSTANTNSGR